MTGGAVDWPDATDATDATVRSKSDRRTTFGSLGKGRLERKLSLESYHSRSPKSNGVRQAPVCAGP
jgi:hypothetical protein